MNLILVVVLYQLPQLLLIMLKWTCLAPYQSHSLQMHWLLCLLHQKSQPLKEMQTLIQQRHLHRHHLHPVISTWCLKTHLVIHHLRPVLPLKLLHLIRRLVRVLHHPSQVVLIQNWSPTLVLESHFLLLVPVTLGICL